MGGEERENKIDQDGKKKSIIFPHSLQKNRKHFSKSEEFLLFTHFSCLFSFHFLRNFNRSCNTIAYVSITYGLIV